jgi:tetratricopeptide (TPR) repeat protein
MFIVSCGLSCGLPSISSPDQPSPLLGMLGQGRAVVSSHFFRLADDYFHCGQRPRKSTPMDGTFLKRASDALRPSKHMHLSGDRIREMMPWLWFALKADPHNVQAQLTVAFWLSGKLGEHAMAQEILRIAQINNPGNEDLYVERGRIFVRAGNKDDAWKMFDGGLVALEARPGDLSEDDRFDKAELLLYRALIDEEHGALDKARAAYGEILMLFPNRVAITKRLASLGDKGGTESPESVLASILSEHDEEKEDHRKHHQEPGDDAHDDDDPHDDGHE